MSTGHEPARGRCVRVGSGEPLPAAGGEVLVGGAETAERLSVLHSTTPPGDEVPAHVHHDLDECFFVLAGHYRVHCGEDTFEAEPGSLVYLPRQVPHSYQVGDTPGRKLIIGVPAGLEDFFRDLGDVDLDELQHRHGVTFL